MSMDSDWYNPVILAELLEIGRHREPTWSAEDLEQILEHQLDMELPEKLLPYLAKNSHANPMGSDIVHSHTFRQIIFSADASIDVLRSIKEYFKNLRHSTNHSLPTEVSTALYYAILAAAWIHLDTWISSVDPMSAQDGLIWLQQQPWIGGDLHQLYAAALQQIAGKPSN